MQRIRLIFWRKTQRRRSNYYLLRCSGKDWKELKLTDIESNDSLISDRFFRSDEEIVILINTDFWQRKREKVCEGDFCAGGRRGEKFMCFESVSDLRVQLGY